MQVFLPGMSVGRACGRGCVLSFAVFGGGTYISLTPKSSCEALTLDVNIERWDPLPPMHEARRFFACAAIGGCVIVAGGSGFTAEGMRKRSGGGGGFLATFPTAPGDSGWTARCCIF